jgi:hypothetical protein
MVGNVEHGGVHPQRPAQPPPRHVEQPPEPGHQVQPGFDRLPHALDPEPAAWAEQATAINNGQRTDVLRPALIRPQHEPVFRGQPFHRLHPRFPPQDRRRLGPWVGTFVPPIGAGCFRTPA